ncbi:testicular acid phosphatase homolog [Haemaphysalis longicornis]
MPRCFDSAALVLYGLYPARGEEAQLEPGRDWQPVGITRLLDDIDKYAALCLPRLHEAVQELSILEIPGSDATAPESRSESASRYLRTAGDVLNYVANMTNVSVDPGIPSYIPAWRNLDSLFVTREYDLPLPEWALEHLHELDWVLGKSIELVSRSQMDNMAGILIKDVVARMRFGDGRGPSLYEGKHETSTGPKMTLFSYHDLNVAGALLGLNGTMTARPPYGSAVIVEAFTTGATETATRLYVRVLYKAGEQLSEIPIEGCDVPCPVEQFDEFVQWRFRPVSREQCGWSEHQPLI